MRVHPPGFARIKYSSCLLCPPGGRSQFERFAGRTRGKLAGILHGRPVTENTSGKTCPCRTGFIVRRYCIIEEDFPLCFYRSSAVTLDLNSLIALEVDSWTLFENSVKIRLDYWSVFCRSGHQIINRTSSQSLIKQLNNPCSIDILISRWLFVWLIDWWIDWFSSGLRSKYSWWTFRSMDYCVGDTNIFTSFPWNDLIKWVGMSVRL